MRYFFTFAYLQLFFIIQIHAQSKVRNEIEQLKIDANNARYSNTELASSLLLKGLRLSKAQNNEIDIGYFYRKLVSEKGYAQQLDSSRYYFLKGMQYYKQTLKNKGLKKMDDKLLKAHLLSELGEAYSVNFLFDQSRIEYIKSMRNYAQLNDYIGVGIVKINLGNLSLKQSDFPSAIETFLEGKAIFDTTEYHYITAEICYGISTTYEKMQRLNRAIEFAHLYLKYMLKGNNEYPGIINAQIYIAKLSAKQGNKTEMNNYLSLAQKGIDSFKLNYLNPALANAMATSLLISKDYIGAKNILLSAKDFLEESKVDAMQVFEYKKQLAKSLVKTGEENQAIQILEEVILMIDSLRLYEEGVGISKMLSQIYEKKKQYNLALNMLKKHEFYEEQTIGMKQQVAFKEIETKYQNSIQKNQLLKQQKKINENSWRLKRNQFWITILILLLILSFLTYFFINKNFREKKEKELREQDLKSSNEKMRISRDLHDNIGAELTLIKSKIDQRIYNLKDEQEIEQLTEISNYSKFAMDELRKTIWATKSNKIQLSELEVKIEQFTQRFKIDYHINANYSDAFISSLTGLNIYRSMQEAIQNIIKHSNANKITISFHSLTDLKVQIEICDNGVGFDINSHRSGNGIENIKERMKEINGDCIIQSSTDGTRVVLNFNSL